MKLRFLGCSILFCLLFSNFINCIGIVNLKLTDLDSSPINLVWCGSNRDTVLILTEKNSVYRSDDLGFNFKKLNNFFFKNVSFVQPKNWLVWLLKSCWCHPSNRLRRKVKGIPLMIERWQLRIALWRERGREQGKLKEMKDV